MWDINGNLTLVEKKKWRDMQKMAKEINENRKN